MAFSPDTALLTRVQAGDSSAMSTLVSNLRPHVERQLLRYPVTDEDRRDLLQATLMQVFRRIRSFRGDSSFSTWLFRVTANEALMLMRSQRRHRARLVEGLELEDLATLPAANDGSMEPSDVGVANQERDDRVRKALEELPQDYRDVVMAHYHLDLGLQEIADRFDLTESAVRSRLHRARTRLRTILEGTAVAAEAIEEARTALPPSARRAAQTSAVAAESATDMRSSMTAQPALPPAVPAAARASSGAPSGRRGRARGGSVQHAAA
jgi:RNA polymerase sigma-70 factor (ECF subfamily)